MSIFGVIRGVEGKKTAQCGHVTRSVQRNNVGVEMGKAIIGDLWEYFKAGEFTSGIEGRWRGEKTAFPL